MHFATRHRCGAKRGLLCSRTGFSHSTKASVECSHVGAQTRTMSAFGGGGGEAAPGASSGAALEYMSPYIRNDFLAQETPVEILPRFELGRIAFLSGQVGPFTPNYPVAVPLWLALFLRETNTCTIRPPEDVSVERLSRVLEYEAAEETSFHALPLHFFSVVRQILRYAASDVPDAAVVHRLVDELEQRRISKITKNLNVLQSVGLRPSAFSLQLTTGEWLFVRATLQRVMNDAVELEARGEQRLHRGDTASAAAAAGGAGSASSSGGIGGSATPGIGTASSQAGAAARALFGDAQPSSSGDASTQESSSVRSRRTLRG
jgi:GINS complex subunit 2